MKDEQVRELLYQALETELGGVEVYTTAIRCAQNDDLKEEWEEYLEQTKKHVQVVQEVLTRLGLNPNEQTPGRKVVKTIGESLVKSMEIALSDGKPGAAQLVACEAVVLAETKDHQNWHLIGEVVKQAKGELAKVLKQAHDQVVPEIVREPDAVDHVLRLEHRPAAAVGQPHHGTCGGELSDVASNDGKVNLSLGERGRCSER